MSVNRSHASAATKRPANVLLLRGNGPLDHGPTVIVPIVTLVPADSPRVDGENEEHIRMLADIDADIPPIVVHRPTMRVVDGMHRLRAALLRGQETIEVRFFDGTEDDAFVLAVELNSGHGLPLSQADRGAAAARIVGSHPHWSDRVIATLTGVSAKTVAAIRSRATAEIPQLHSRIGRDGKVRPFSTAHGRRLAGKLMAEMPDMSLRDVAKESGVSVGTVRDVRRRVSLGLDPVPPKQRLTERADAEPERPAVLSLRAGTTVSMPVAEALPVLLDQLKKDPSLRFSEVGRVLLRLLDAHSIPMATWTRLVESVPSHCSEAVAGLAMSCADSWRQFAEQVGQRDTDTP
jgi:ParB-like chromosome segregation protein Spo0J